MFRKTRSRVCSIQKLRIQRSALHIKNPPPSHGLTGPPSEPAASELIRGSRADPRASIHPRLFNPRVRPDGDLNSVRVFIAVRRRSNRDRRLTCKINNSPARAIFN